MQYIKKISLLVILCVYILFAQFFVKAFVTTKPKPVSLQQDSFCLQKQLDTHENKHNCRSKNNIGFFMNDLGEIKNLKKILSNFFDTTKISSTKSTFNEYSLSRFIGKYRTGPPNNGSEQLFLLTYIGTKLNLVYN